MSHYETLGIKPDASADEVKQAYRASSSKVHPDKGGTDEAMAKVNRAYEVLSNPERRANYDAGTGEAGDSLEDQARAMLADLIDAVLDSPETDMIAACNMRLSEAKVEVGTMRRRAESELKRLAKRRKSVAKKGDGHNLVHAIIDKKVERAEGNIAKANAVMTLLDAVRELLKDYEHVPGHMTETRAPTTISDFAAMLAEASASRRGKSSLYGDFGRFTA